MLTGLTVAYPLFISDRIFVTELKNNKQKRMHAQVLFIFFIIIALLSYNVYAVTNDGTIQQQEQTIIVSFVNVTYNVLPCENLDVITSLSQSFEDARYTWTLVSTTAVYYKDLAYILESFSDWNQQSIGIPWQIVSPGNNYTIKVSVETPAGTASAQETFTILPYTGTYSLEPKTPLVQHLNSKDAYTFKVGASNTDYACFTHDIYKDWYTYKDGQIFYDHYHAIAGHLNLVPRALAEGGIFNFTMEMRLINQNFQTSLNFSVIVEKPVANIQVDTTAPVKLYEPLVFSANSSYDPEGTDPNSEYFEWSCDNCIIENKNLKETNISFTYLGQNIVTLLYIPYKDVEKRKATASTSVVSVVNPMSVSFGKDSSVLQSCETPILSVIPSRPLYLPRYIWTVTKSSVPVPELTSYLNSVNANNGTLDYLSIVSSLIPMGNNVSIQVNATEQYYRSSSIITLVKQPYSDVLIKVSVGSMEGSDQQINSHNNVVVNVQSTSTSSSCVSDDVNQVYSLYDSAGTLVFQSKNNAAQFSFPERYFQVGGTFKFTAKVTYPNYPSLAVHQSISLYSQKPVVTIQSGDRVVKRMELFTMKPSLNYDPEESTLNYERFEWSCNGCTFSHANNAVTNVTIPDLGIYPMTLLYFPDYRYTLRNTSTTISITAVGEDIPMIQIHSQLPPVINPQNQIKIEAAVSDVDRLLKGLITFTWTILSQKTIVKQLPATSKLLPLIIQPNDLKEGTDYEFKLRARYISTLDLELNYSYTSVFAKTTVTPVLDKFSISPDTGFALDTQFQMACTGKSLSTDPLVNYRFEVFDQILNDFTILRTAGTENTFSTFLQQGNTMDQLKIRCVVMNSYGCQASNTATVTVAKIQGQTVKQIINQVQTIVESNRTSDSVSVAQSVTTLAQELQKSGNTEDLVQVQKIVGQMLTQISNQSISDISSDDVEKTVTILETLSRADTISSSAPVAYGIVNQILSSSDKALVSQKIINSVAQFVSNMIEGKPSDPVIVESTVNTIDVLRKAVTSKLSLSEEQTVISTNSFDMAVKLDYGSNLQNTTVSSLDGNIVNIPEIDSLVPDQQYSYELTVFKASINPYQFSNSSTSSSVLNFKLLSGNNKVPLSELKNPIEIVLNIQRSIEKNETNLYKHSCMYWDGGDEWNTYGCWLHNVTDTQIICRCNHTTSFASFIIYDPAAPNKSAAPLYIVSIFMNAGFAAFSASLLLLSIIFRKEQPIRSRHIVPFIGLSAILFESVLQGIVRNSLLVASKEASDYKPINNISYVLMVVVNPLVLVSLVVFFIQQVRYFFMNNLYEILNNDGKNATIIRLYRVLTSKVLFYVAAGVIWTVTTIYYLLFAILNVTGVMSAVDSTSTNAISYSAMSFVLAIFIVLAFLWDSLIVTSTKISKAIEQKKEEGTDTTIEAEMVSSTATSIRDHFGKDDPLKFRTETIFMTIAMLVLIVSYVLGLVDRYNTHSSANSPVKIIQAIFDWIYISFRIVSFGGYAIVTYFIAKYRQRTIMEKLLTSNNTTDSQSGGDILEQILNDSKGYALLKAYSRMEYSVENCLFYELLTKLRSENLVMTSTERTQSIQAIWDKYVKNGSDLEVNIGNKSKKSVQGLLDQTSQQVTADTFENVLLELYGEVMKNLSDTFIRMSGAPEYNKYIEFKQMHHELQSVSSFTDLIAK
jgi:hypothetical protein